MEIIDLGLSGYEEVLSRQKELHQKRVQGEVPDTLIVVEHDAVVTLGRNAKKESITDRGFFEERNILIVETDRGGEVTFHSPGQLVLYPVIDLTGKKKDISFYIDFLEKTASLSLKRLGAPAERTERRGVWVKGKKIAFIGIKVKNWVTFHGVAVNINNDTTPFNFMHPCGESDIKVTSLKEELGHEVSMARVKEVFIEEFTKALETEYTVREHEAALA